MSTLPEQPNIPPISGTAPMREATGRTPMIHFTSYLALARWIVAGLSTADTGSRETIPTQEDIVAVLRSDPAWAEECNLITADPDGDPNCEGPIEPDLDGNSDSSAWKDLEAVVRHLDKVTLWGTAALQAAPRAMVILCETPDAAQAARGVFPNAVCMAPKNLDLPLEQWLWRRLTERTVCIWPNAGSDFGSRAGAQLAQVHAAIYVLDFEEVEDLRGGPIPLGWNATDVHVEDGLSNGLLATAKDTRCALWKPWIPPTHDLMIPVPAPVGEPWKICQVADQDQDGCELFTKEPLRNADKFVMWKFSTEGVSTMRLFAGSIYLYDGKVYHQKHMNFLTKEVYRFLERGYVFDPEKRKHVPFTPNKYNVEALEHALRSLIFVDSQRFPCWATPVVGAPDVTELVPFKNGLLNIKQWMKTGEDSLLPHTPALLSTSLLPMDFHPQAVCPQWRTFLDQALLDAESIEALRLWFGYCLTHDTSQHKMLLLIGPPRTGKSTILRILRAILGEHNAAAPSLSSLGSEFGLAPLMGKLAAIIPDAHIRTGDRVRVLETLKCIIGEDPITINIKHKDQVTMRLSVRFSLAANDLMNFPDASGSLVSRMIIIPVPNSFEGQEDRGLESRLLTELPGICNWALSGLRQYHETGKLIQPAVGLEEVSEMERLSSPYKAFVKDMCDYPMMGQTTSVDDMWLAWQDWCIHENHHPVTRATFGRGLKSACPKAKKVLRGPKEAREYQYENIAINAEGKQQIWGSLTTDQKTDSNFIKQAETRRRNRRKGTAS